MRARNPAGFTLIEVGLVVAIAAIFVAVVLPNLVETTRSRLTERAAAEVTRLQDAARFFFVESSPAIDPGTARWPGEVGPRLCNLRASDAAKQDLIAGANGGYLKEEAFKNPWGQPYELSLQASGGDRDACLLVVSTVIPSALEGLFTTALPTATCDNSCAGFAPVPAGSKRCCSAVPKSGTEADIAAVTQALKTCP